LAARLPRPCLRWAHTPSAAFRSGAWAGSRTAVNQSAWASRKARILTLTWGFKLSHTRIIGAFNCWCAVVSRAAY